MNYTHVGWFTGLSLSLKLGLIGNKPCVSVVEALPLDTCLPIYACYPPNSKDYTSLFAKAAQSSTSDCIALAIGGIDVNRTVIVPKIVIARIDSAAARGSVRRSNAAPMADELAPKVTPRVT